mmetsp:Transcript_62655/g.186753  ORF Transcript_62655/g.186753 Transcript_62655/m.186753 type:complete len:380 (+) Transcript_62655:147-1286(+)
MALHYDPEAGYLATAFRLTNTVVPEVLSHIEFWLFLALHMSVYVAFRNGYLDGSDEEGSMLHLGWNEMKIISAATTFFEVFYTNQCFARYNSLYSLSRKMLGNLYDFVFEVRLHLRGTSQSHVRLAGRWFTASVVLFFYETNSDVSEREWAELLRQGLIKPDEKEFLSQFHRHQRSLILLQWSADVCRDGCTQAKAAANVLKSMVEKLLKSRFLEQAVVDTNELQLPFQYFHLLNMMVVVNLLFWAYGMGTTESAFAPVTFFFAALIFMGMLELASALSDPFGDDEVDFPVVNWMNEFLENTIVLLEFDCPITMESRLATEMPMHPGKRHLNLFLEENLTTPGVATAQMQASFQRELRRLSAHSNDEEPEIDASDESDD